MRSGQNNSTTLTGFQTLSGLKLLYVSLKYGRRHKKSGMLPDKQKRGYVFMLNIPADDDESQKTTFCKFNTDKLCLSVPPNRFIYVHASSRYLLPLHRRPCCLMLEQFPSPLDFRLRLLHERCSYFRIACLQRTIAVFFVGIFFKRD